MDIRLTDTPSFHPILSDCSLFFLSAENDTLHLSRMDLRNPSSDAVLPFPIEISFLPFSWEFSIANSNIYYNQLETPLAHWISIPDTADNNSPRRILHVGKFFLVSAEMDDYGGQNVRALYLVDPFTGQEGVFRHVY